jgi:hypothetical protein
MPLSLLNTSAEAAALATLFTPGYPTLACYEYSHNIAAYISLVTGAKARLEAA